jgi:putative pyruvate formate lyase activating enzyme
VKSQARQFESLKIWESFKNRLPWYFAVSTNDMPAKYLIAKRIPCNLDLSSATEGELWSENGLLTQTFLDMWQKVRVREISALPPKVTEGPSLMDLGVELAKRMLAHCNFCRWDCKVDRSKGIKHGTCQLESTSKVGSYFHHRGEELIFRGSSGSGTIFFTSCNMRCSFCQNGDISTDKDNGIPITPSTLALMAWQLRMEGCHNVNWVGGEPTIHLHTIVEAISLLDSFSNADPNQIKYVQSVKSDDGSYFGSWQINSEHAFYQDQFNCPQLWNSNFFMSQESMSILRNIMDVWLPDFKFGPGKCALDISRTPWYWETVTNNIKLVHDWRENMIIRHLIMPNHIECCTKPVLDWIAKNMPEVPVNIMDQYHPDNLCDPDSSKYRERYNDISRACNSEEITNSYKYAKELGLNFEPLSYEKSIYGLKV